MKTFILLFLLVTIFTTAFTQIRKGQFLIGGALNFESTKIEYLNNPTQKLNNLLISPNIGYFVIDKMAGGLRIDFRSYNQYSENLVTHQTNTSISPFLRYYFLPLLKKVNAFIDFSYINTKTKFHIPSNPGYFEKAKDYHISAGPAIFLTDQIALEFIIGYRHTKSDDYDKTETNIFNSGFGLQIHFGKIKNKSKK